MQILLIVTLVLAPTYAIRFNFFGFPANLLMVWIFLFWVIFFYTLISKKQISNFFESVKTFDKKILLGAAGLFLAGLMGLFVYNFDRAKLGQFLVLFFQPIITFFIARFIVNQNPKTKNLVLVSCYLSLALAGILAVLQYVTLFTLPAEFWGNSVEPKRAIAFFIHPNFYALWCAPLLAFLIPDLKQKIDAKNFDFVIMWLLGGLGLFLSLSRAGWLGLAFAIFIYLIFAADKKIRKLAAAAVIVIVIVILAIPNFRYRLLLPFYGEKSAVSRTSLWETGLKGIKESPVFGLGLTGFSQNWYRLNTDPNLDTHNFPHNIFLDLWVEIGLMGLISAVLLMSFAIYHGIKNRQDTIKLGVALFIICLLAQGQIDNPYFKNDLALVFWIILGFI